ncbi:hypothetical protein M404DRAFT_1007448, partial [Pisolithus tinctorius Marx 270]
MKSSPDIFHFSLSTGHGRLYNTRCIWISSLAPPPITSRRPDFANDEAALKYTI